MNKVAIIGTGFVGSSIAYALSLRNQVKQIILINREVEPSVGEMLDINHGFHPLKESSILVGDYSMIHDADLIVVSAGRHRKPDETRTQLASENALIIQEIATNIKQHYTKGKVLVITNPVDVLTQKMHELFSSSDIVVIGSGTMLDSSRLRFALQEEQDTNHQELLIGEHGDGIIPLSHSFGRQSRFLNDHEFQSTMIEYIRGLGTTIIRSKGKTQFGIVTCVSYLVEMIESDIPILTAVSLPLKEVLGWDCALSVPVSISKNGIEQRVDLIQSSEIVELKKVANKVLKVLDEIRS
jgi:L-lactate dehydrogenase